MFELAARRREVGIAALGHPAPRELNVPLVERSLDLEQQEVALDIKHD